MTLETQRETDNINVIKPESSFNRNFMKDGKTSHSIPHTLNVNEACCSKKEDIGLIATGGTVSDKNGDRVL